MIAYVIKTFVVKPKIVKDKYDRRKNSSYKYQFVVHNALEIDNYIVLNSLTKTDINLEIIKNFDKVKFLSFKAASVVEDDEEIPKQVKFVHIFISQDH